MTQEEKQLLLNDISARLPHNVVIRCTDNDTDYKCFLTTDILNELLHNIEYYDYKPYLRPISSMTEDEMDKLFDVLHIDKEGNDEDWIKINDVLGIKFFFQTGKWAENVAEAYDYLNSIHIDYRGLIEKGLALEAPKDMYKQ
jgi:hypothetical protein